MFLKLSATTKRCLAKYSNVYFAVCDDKSYIVICVYIINTKAPKPAIVEAVSKLALKYSAIIVLTAP